MNADAALALGSGRGRKESIDTEFILMCSFHARRHRDPESNQIRQEIHFDEN